MMRPIHTTKRLYSIAASSPLKPTVRPTPISPRPRRASLSVASAVGSPSTSSSASTSSSTVVGSSGSRSLYTNASGSPLHYFDSAPPPPPPLLSSRPINSNPSSSPRLSAGEAQAQATQGSTHGNNPSANSTQTPHSPYFANGAQSTQQNSNGQGHHGQTSSSQQAAGSNQPLFGTSLMLSLGEPIPPTGSSPPDYGFFLGGPRSSLAADHSWHSRESVASGADRQVKEDQNIIDTSSTGQKMYQLDVGAYGIPKRGRVSTRARPCSCATCSEGEDVYALHSLENAVQVGEDAYFVREDALGVADGVGGWSSRASSSRTSTSMHSCSTCATASTSSQSARHMHTHKQYHKPSASQPSPSALFARRLMHFCSQEVGEARASATTFNSTLPGSVSQIPDVVAKATKPSLKDGGISPRVTTNGRRKTVLREHGNARPSNWPWESDSSNPSLEALLEEDHLGKTTGPSESRIPAAGDVKQAQDPLDGTVDPVDVLERAYSKTIDVHRVRRRVRVVKTRETPPRWWSYSLGLGSTSPKAVSTTSPDTASISVGVEKPEDSEWEWQEIWEPLNYGSSTALLAVLSGNRLRVAHLGDCIGWLVRGGEIVWRSEEMWWDFNYPVQLGPASPTRPSDARRYELSVQADDILILASDGMSDNCWEEDVLDEVRRAVEAHLPVAKESDRNCDDTGLGGLLGRRTLAAMLSEALCSRARQSSTQTHGSKRTDKMVRDQEVEELPFERRAREEGRSFRGGKSDDISVLVAIISPVQKSSTQATLEGDDVTQERQSEVASPATE